MLLRRPPRQPDALELGAGLARPHHKPCRLLLPLLGPRAARVMLALPTPVTLFLTKLGRVCPDGALLAPALLLLRLFRLLQLLRLFLKKSESDSDKSEVLLEAMNIFPQT